MSNPPLRGGDAIFFWGSDFLERGIETLTRGPGHLVMVLPPELDVALDGQPMKEVFIIESTISDQDNGVQCAPLARRIADYGGGSVVAAYLSDRVRAFLDWDSLWRYAKGNLDRRYNVLEIGAYLLNFVLPGALQINAPSSAAAVCSEFYGELLRAGGWPGLNPFQSPPAYFWRSKMWREAFVLSGPKPEGMHEFNLV